METCSFLNVDRRQTFLINLLLQRALNLPRNGTASKRSEPRAPKGESVPMVWNLTHFSNQWESGLSNSSEIAPTIYKHGRYVYACSIFSIIPLHKGNYVNGEIISVLEVHEKEQMPQSPQGSVVKDHKVSGSSLEMRKFVFRKYSISSYG